MHTESIPDEQTLRDSLDSAIFVKSKSVATIPRSRCRLDLSIAGTVSADTGPRRTLNHDCRIHAFFRESWIAGMDDNNKIFKALSRLTRDNLGP
jgi:hypothetical protein